jgi:hypothetical protein
MLTEKGSVNTTEQEGISGLQEKHVANEMLLELTALRTCKTITSDFRSEPEGRWAQG